MPLTFTIAESLTRAALAQSPARATFTWKGRTFSGVTSDKRNSRSYRAEGFAPGYKTTWMGVAADFSATGFPPVGTVLMVSGQQLKIQEQTTDAANAMVMLDFADLRG